MKVRKGRRTKHKEEKIKSQKPTRNDDGHGARLRGILPIWGTAASLEYPCKNYCKVITIRREQAEKHEHSQRLINWSHSGGS